MANQTLLEQNFGMIPKDPPMRKGSMKLFGHMVNEQPLPSKGVSVNVKTGYPVTEGRR